MIRKKSLYKKIGIFGGTFDPPHKGHFQIANSSLRKLKLHSLIWIITKKNPLKKKPILSLKKRIFLSKKITKNIKKIKVRSYSNFVKSSKTVDLIKYLKKRNNKVKFYFIMGSDNILKFHKWHSWNEIPNLCKIVVFPREGFSKKILTSKAYRALKREKAIFLKLKIVNISSSKIRKNYLGYLQ